MPARKNAAGRWEQQVMSPPNARGEKKRLYVVCPPGYNTKEFCNELVRKAIERHVKDAPSSDLTFGQFFETIFLPEYPASRNLQPSSVDAYRYLVGKLACPVIGKTPIGQVDGGVVARLVGKLAEQDRVDASIAREMTRAAAPDKGLSAATIDKAIVVLDYVLAWAAARTPALAPRTPLQAAVEMFFAARTELAKSSAALYRYHLARHVVPHVGKLAIGKVTDKVRTELRETLGASGRRQAVFVDGAVKKDGSLKKPWELAREKRRGSKVGKATKRFSPQTLRNLVVGIKAVLSWAQDRKHIALVPKIEIPKVPRPRMDQPYSIEEARRLISAAPSEMRQLLYILSFDSGCRKSELLGLEWEQVDFTRHQIVFDRQLYRGQSRQTKSGKERVVPMTPQLERAMKARKLQYGSLSGYVFCQDDGTPLAEHHLRRFEEWDAVAAGLRKVRWHHKRHTFADLAIAGGTSTWGLQNLLGHADIRTTQGYVQAAHQPMKSVLGSDDAPAISARQ